MNYIWEVALKADACNVKRENLRYVAARIYSPYIEASFVDLNQGVIDDMQIEVNALYRFSRIFEQILDINLVACEKTRHILLDICLQYFIQTNLRQGMSKSAYYLRFILRDLLRKVCQEEMSIAIQYFSSVELKKVLICILIRMKTSCSIILFRQVMRAVYPDSLVYSNNEVYRELLIYIGKKETEAERAKIDFLIDTFLPINYTTHLFWEHHFGIIDVDITMQLDEMVLF